MDVTAQPRTTLSSEDLAGDVSPLAQALGTPGALTSFSSLAEILDAPRPDSPSAVRAFLARYRERLLSPVELPAIQAAYHHASRGEVRELLELDRQLRSSYGSTAFAEASRHTGRTQLRRLRPLRDRTLQRYLQAVESGEATGWHVIVFGLLLALFSLPLRQGLLHYASKTQHSLVDSATVGTATTLAERNQLCDECDGSLPGALPPLVSALPS